MNEILVAWIFAIVIILVVVGPPLLWLFSRPETISPVTTEEDEQEWQNESQEQFRILEETIEDVPIHLQKEPKRH